MPFLYQNSSVNDFFRGDIGTPFTSVVNSDVSLVMYYAPWDFDSQLTRKVFDQVALKYKDQVHFAFPFPIYAEINGNSFPGVFFSSELLGPKWRV